LRKYSVKIQQDSFRIALVALFCNTYPGGIIYYQ
jgi:hypothetical protein